MALDPRSFVERRVYPNMRHMENNVIQQEDLRNTPIQGPISPTRSSVKLMRQISALGMEDPIFFTTEDVPDHPSNIFPDMGLDDIPSDMQDLMSVASDPTAKHGAGLDESFLRFTLNCSMQMPSNFVAFSNESFFEKIENGRCSQKNDLDSAPKLVDISNLPGTDRGFSIVRDTNTPVLPSLRRIGLLHSQSAAHRIKTNQYSSATSSLRKDGLVASSDHTSHKKNVRQNKDPWNASVPSLDVNGVFSCSNHSRLGAKENYSSNCAMHDPLLVEATIALGQHQSWGSKLPVVSNEIVATTKSQNSVDKRFLQTPKERRVLPTLSGLFSP